MQSFNEFFSESYQTSVEDLSIPDWRYSGHMPFAKAAAMYYQQKLKPRIVSALGSEFKLGTGGYLHRRWKTILWPKSSNSDIHHVTLRYSQNEQGSIFPKIQADTYLKKSREPEIQGLLHAGGGSLLGPVLASMPDGSASSDNSIKDFTQYLQDVVKRSRVACK